MTRLTAERAEAILGALERVHVLVVGDLMLDRYITGSVDRISPEAPVPVVRVVDESLALGGAANVAANVVALGAACDVVGCVGRDENGELLVGALGDAGVSTEGVVQTEARPTTVKTRVLARRQQVVRVDREDDSDVDGALAEALADAAAGRVGDASVIAMEDYNKGVLVPPVIGAVRAHAERMERPTVVDPKRLRFFGYPGVTVFKPNRKELEDALSDHVHPDDAAWMEATRRRLGCLNLLLTLGEHGASIATERGEHVRVPTVARAVYDVSGAGDTVTAVVASALGAGASPVEAAVLANHAAAVEVGKTGVATVSPREIIEHCRTHEEITS